MAKINITNIKQYNSYYSFIEENNLEKWFKSKYEIDFEDWDNDISDEEIINEALKDDCLDGNWINLFINHADGYFLLIKI